MPTCCIVGCSNRKGEDQRVNFHRFPSLREHEGPEVVALMKERRRLWKAAVNRTLTESRWEKSWICSKHFTNGIKSTSTIIKLT